MNKMVSFCEPSVINKVHCDVPVYGLRYEQIPLSLISFRMTNSNPYVMVSVSEPSVTNEIYADNLYKSEKFIATCQSIGFVLNRFFSRYAPSE
jgi:hypothetical protein